jgi:hypothetical protein
MPCSSTPQQGSGKRASLFTDYTFGLWKDEELVPFAKAYSGLSDEEIREVDAFIRKNTLERFGPVRTVKPELVFELGFEGIQRSRGTSRDRGALPADAADAQGQVAPAGQHRRRGVRARGPRPPGLGQGVAWRGFPRDSVCMGGISIARTLTMRTIALLLGIIVASTLAAAQTMYKWVDKDGKTHYTDTPPPEEAKKLAPPKGTASPGPAAKGRGGGQAADGQQGRTQRSFRPEEQTALQVMCGIALLEALTCQLELKRWCSMDELVNGINGDKSKAFERDPRSDPNYDYRVDFRGGDFSMSAVPKKPASPASSTRGMAITTTRPVRREGTTP